MFVAAIISVVAAALGAVSATDGICKLNLQTQLDPLKEPLILEDIKNRDQEGHTLAIIRPQVEVINKETQGVIHINEGKELLIACPGVKNAVKASNNQTASVQCLSGQLTINDKPVNKTSLSCTKGVANSCVISTRKKCGKGDNVGTTFELGFRLNDADASYFPMVEVCYNSDKMVTYYSTHEVYGASLGGRVKSSKRRSFSPGPANMKLFTGVSPDKAYHQEEQKEILDTILGEGEGARYLSKKVFLARGHLAPDADFIYNSGQLMTYYYINAAPQWQTFNAGNWLQVENAVRALASQTNATLAVWTGTYGILKLEDNEGNEKEIYLDPKESNKPKKSSKPRENHIPVPEVYWKLVQHPKSKSCTVAVGHNNVFKNITGTICNFQEKIGWPKLDNFQKGYVYYCDYESFKKTVSYVPDIKCTDLLKFPQIKQTETNYSETEETGENDESEASEESEESEED